MKKFTLIMALILWASAANAATWYVDNAAAGSNNGTSWANAWTALSNITGVQGGDIVYISGGTSGRTYPGYTFPAGTSSNSRVTYKVGQDSSHNGLVTFSGVVRLLSYTIFDGEYNGSRRFKVTGELQAYSTQYVIITYVYSGSMNFNYSTTEHYEVSHCSTYQPLNADHWISFNDTPTLTWGANSVHDNYVELAHDTDASGYGTDGLQNLTSADIYNNTFIGIGVTGARGNHQDGIQTDGSYMRVYNNTFVNMGNYAIFWELFGTTTDVRIYNNLIYMKNTEFANGYQQAIVIGTTNPSYVYPLRFLVANNTIANYNPALNVISPRDSTYTIWDSSSVVYNNIVCGGSLSLSPAVIGYNSPTNKSVTSCANIFAAYQTPTSSNYAYDFHLKSTDTVLKDQGSNAVSSYFTTDKDGVSRPLNSAWDIGAYEGPGVASVKPMPPSMLSIN